MGLLNDGFHDLNSFFLVLNYKNLRSMKLVRECARDFYETKSVRGAAHPLLLAFAQYPPIGASGRRGILHTRPGLLKPSRGSRHSSFAFGSVR